MNIFNKNLLRRRLSIFLLLTLYVGLCFEAAAFPPDVMAVGELHELDCGYSIKVVEADVERGEAVFVLYKERRAVDETVVSSGEWFSLDDGEIFHFEAILDSVFRYEEMTMAVFRYEEKIMVRLTDIDYWYNADAETIPEEEWPEWPEEEWNDESPNPIPSIIAVMIMFIFVIFISIRLKNRRHRKKIEEYKAKMHKLEKEGYDVSELKGVLEGKKREKIIWSW